MDPAFDRSVFINCPFDEDYAPLLQAIAFCVTDLGFTARLAPENSDNAASRLERIVELVRMSKYGIHDLSRCKASELGEFSRLNMAFELGLDHSCARFGGPRFSTKSILVLEEIRYDSQKALSDIAGWDVEAHKNNHISAVRIVRQWLNTQTNASLSGATKILSNYGDFQEWYWERETALGASDEDIMEYPTVDFVRAMNEWVSSGRPLSSS